VLSGTEVMQQRKVIKDKFRKKFLKIFDAEWLRAQIQRHIIIVNQGNIKLIYNVYKLILNIV
jgi:hypothetical protein